MSYSCMIGCKTCNFAPPGVRFYTKNDVLSIIFHKHIIGDHVDREVRVRFDDEQNTLSDFFAQHQSHELVFIDKEGIHIPSLDDLPPTTIG